MKFDLRQKFTNLPDSRQKRIMYILPFVVILTIAVSSYIYYVFTGVIDGDLINYYRNASDFLDNHLMPYSDYMFEYPPLSLVIFLIPKIFSWDFSSFVFSYFVFAIIATMIIVHFTVKLCDKYGWNRFKVLIMVVLLLIAANKFILQRNDIFAVMLTVVALYLFSKDNYVLSATSLGMATMIKLYPMVLVPVFAIMLFTRKDWKNTALFFIAAALICFIIELPFLINDPSTAFAYLTYHMDRGLQVESVISSFIMAIDFFIPVMDGIEFLYGSVTITGKIPDIIAGVSSYLLVAALIVMAAWMIYRLWNNNKDGKVQFKILALMSIIAVSTFIIFSKVFSTQYVLWIFAFMPFISLEGKFENSLFVAFVILVLVTPIFSGMVYDQNCLSFAEIGLIVKNMVFIVLFIIWIKKFIRMTEDIKKECKID